MESIATPTTLSYYKLIGRFSSPLKTVLCKKIAPYMIPLDENSSLDNEYVSDTFWIAYGGWSSGVINHPRLNIIVLIALSALIPATYAKWKNPSLSVWKNIAFEQLPKLTCTYLPAFVVKQIFFLIIGRSTIDHAQRIERMTYIVMTMSLSTFVMPHLYAKFKGKTTPISNLGLAKYFTIQCIWHLIMNECIALTAAAMHKNIQDDPKKWFCVAQYTNLDTPEYNFEKTLVESLNVDSVQIGEFDTDKEREWAILHRALYYISSKPLFDAIIKKEGTNSQQAQSVLTEIKEQIKEKYPFLCYTDKEAQALKVNEITFTDHLEDKEICLWVYFLDQHKDHLNPDVVSYLKSQRWRASLTRTRI